MAKILCKEIPRKSPGILKRQKGKKIPLPSAVACIQLNEEKNEREDFIQKYEETLKKRIIGTSEHYKYQIDEAGTDKYLRDTTSNIDDDYFTDVHEHLTIMLDFCETFIKENLGKTTDYSLFMSLISGKLNMLYMLCLRRAGDYMMNFNEEHNLQPVVDFVLNSLTKNVCFIIAESLILFSHSSWCEGRFAFQSILEKLTSYITDFGRKIRLRSVDYFEEKFDQVEATAQTFQERIFDAIGTDC